MAKVLREIRLGSIYFVLANNLSPPLKLKSLIISTNRTAVRFNDESNPFAPFLA